MSDVSRSHCPMAVCHLMDILQRMCCPDQVSLGLYCLRVKTSRAAPGNSLHAKACGTRGSRWSFAFTPDESREVSSGTSSVNEARSRILCLCIKPPLKYAHLLAGYFKKPQAWLPLLHSQPRAGAEVALWLYEAPGFCSVTGSFGAHHCFICSALKMRS